MNNIFTNERRLARLFFVMSVTPLAVALVSQYKFGMHPCHLCIFQRIPYAVIIFFSLINIIKPTMRVTLVSTVITIHAFLINSGIAFFHTGVERHWWQNTGCASTLNTNSIEALKASLLAAPSVRCDEVQFQFLNLSMASWNCIYCLAAGLFAIYALVRYFRFKRSQAMQ